MTLKLSLTPDLEKRLKMAASRNGKRADEYVVQLLNENLPTTESNVAAAQMLLGWAKEDERMSDDDSAANERILRAIDEDRLSDRKLFTDLLKGKKS